MSKILIIAEKPSVAREIAPLVGAGSRRDGFLEGAEYIVSWAVGHLVNIAEPEEQDPAWGGRWALEQLPMIPQKFKLTVLNEARKQFEVVRRLMHREDVGEVVNATDAGREGELIFRRIQLHAECDKPVRRMWANDMTEEGLRRSLSKLLKDAAKRNLGLAAFARAEADWLIGMNLSRLFTLKANSLISVGRVQTPVLKLICDRRDEIENFIPADFWTVEACFGKNPPKIVSAVGTADSDACKQESAGGAVDVALSTSALPQTDGGAVGAHASASDGQDTSGVTEAANTNNAQPLQDAPTAVAASDDSGNASSKAAETESADSQEDTFRAVWYLPPDFKETRLEAQSDADAVISRCQGQAGVVDKVESRKGTQQPPLPFDLTTLQREANSRFGYSAKETLAIAQALYEQRKLITYPRTDSRYLTKDLFKEVLKHFRAIYKLYPEETVPAVERVKAAKKFACVNDKKVTDHHAIIPTAAQGRPESLTEQERNVYDMVCRRFIAAFSAPAEFGASTVTVKVADDVFIARGKVFKSIGWLAVEPWRTAEDNPLPSLRKGARLHVHEVTTAKRQTKAPAHFTDASLLAAMETAGKLVDDEELRNAMKERGLGTPATRAQIIETLLSRGYVEKKGKKLIATDAGMQAVALVSSMLPDIASPELTGQWEKKLKDIEAGEHTYPQFMHDIRVMLAGSVQRIKPRNVKSILVETAARLASRELDGKCPLCGAEVEERDKGFGCSKWRRSDGGCPFMIWKTVMGATLDAELVRQLLEKGCTDNELELTSKSGNTFSAKLKLEQGRVRPAFSSNGSGGSAPRSAGLDMHDPAENPFLAEDNPFPPDMP
ncbi:DNA topoisomerase [Oleidesulfovibrio sp.]|uniref:type IA DNA topoisomerase n=1 Tax=Oleidesulfovibrio sp. TaxID=2909707 RepID=UPI003A890E8C